MAEAQLAASIVLQELLEELVPPRSNRTMNWNIWQHCYWKRRRHLPLALQAILRMSSLIYQTASLKTNFERKEIRFWLAV